MRIGETRRRLVVKEVLSAVGRETKEACGVDQLCARLGAGIEAEIHAMRLLEGNWGLEVLTTIYVRSIFTHQTQ